MEKELKFALTQSQYRKLKSLCTKRVFEQTNVYFETPTRRLKREGAGLRVRIENSKRATLTLKMATAQTAKGTKRGWHSRQEWEAALPLSLALALTANRKRLTEVRSPVLTILGKMLPGVEVESLTVLGKLETARRPLRIGRYLGELDQWKVAGQTFYELEVEASDLAAAEKAVRDLFAAHKIPVRTRSQTKLATLFRLTKKRART